MSYRDLQPPVAHDKLQLFENACIYANDLWMRGLPARAILALCRAIYIDPMGLDPLPEQPYRAYVWFLKNHEASGFLGNPRMSFARQATRIPAAQHLKITRAWALWTLTRAAMPELPADPGFAESPPPVEALIEILGKDGLPEEEKAFIAALEDTLPAAGN